MVNEWNKNLCGMKECTFWTSYGALSLKNGEDDFGVKVNLYCRERDAKRNSTILQGVSVFEPLWAGPKLISISGPDLVVPL
jgi:hypothetical protein